MNRHLTFTFAIVALNLFPSVASAQNIWAGDFYGQDARLNNDYDWMSGYWKGECGYDSATGENMPILAGLSTELDLAPYDLDHASPVA